jgi:flagellar P-ring protein precursor FlgI
MWYRAHRVYILTATVAMTVATALMPKAVDAAVRLKDIAQIEGVRDNQLIGYGLVVGLNGTGDSAAITRQAMTSMFERMGLTVSDNEISSSNVASVMVTATLPPFAANGTRIDVIISSVGDANDLEGGTLLMTPLAGADGKVYAVAQGPVSIGGFNAGVQAAGGSTIQKNHPTAGRIPGGALIEREVPSYFIKEDALTVTLRQPDFTTCSRLVAALNENIMPDLAVARDAGTVKVKIPDTYGEDVIGFISRLEGVTVVPDAVARVVINERTGTVVAGEHVKISTVAVSHGNLSIEIKSQYQISQPQSFSEMGVTVALPEAQAYVEEEESRMIVLQEGVNIGEVAGALNALGVTPRDMISIFQAIKEAGALQAELVIM